MLESDNTFSYIYIVLTYLTNIFYSQIGCLHKITGRTIPKICFTCALKNQILSLWARSQFKPIKEMSEVSQFDGYVLH